MRKLILSLIVLLTVPSAASANGVPTLTIAPDGLSFTVSIPAGYSAISYNGWLCDRDQLFSEPLPYLIPGEVYITYAPEPISKVEIFLIDPAGDNYFLSDSRYCVLRAEPLFMMWLLTRGDQGCILLSETHPSIERQKALCFPATDPDWVADNAPCADYVYDDDTWSCDAFGFPRLPLHDENGPDLWEVWQRHAARQQE